MRPPTVHGLLEEDRISFERERRAQSSAAFRPAGLWCASFLESGARVFVIAAGPPVASSRIIGWTSLGGTFFFGRVPEPPARKPLEEYVGVRSSQLRQR